MEIRNFWEFCRHAYSIYFSKKYMNTVDEFKSIMRDIWEHRSWNFYHSDPSVSPDKLYKGTNAGADRFVSDMIRYIYIHTAMQQDDRLLRDIAMEDVIFLSQFYQVEERKLRIVSCMHCGQNHVFIDLLDFKCPKCGEIAIVEPQVEQLESTSPDEKS